MHDMLAAVEDSSGTIILATGIMAVALIVFGFLIGGEHDPPDGSEKGKGRPRATSSREGSLPPDGADLWRQFVAERRRSQDLEASIASFHDQLHVFNPMTPYRYAQLHDQIHRDLEAHGISEVSVQEEIQDL